MASELRIWRIVREEEDRRIKGSVLCIVAIPELRSPLDAWQMFKEELQPKEGLYKAEWTDGYGNIVGHDVFHV